MLTYKKCLVCSKKYKIWNGRIKTSKYCSRKCNGIALKNKFKGGNHPQWKGGRVRSSQGYIHIFLPKHPKNNNHYYPEHRHIMENKIGRFLKNNEVVHHINGNRIDNRLENLILMTNSTHMRLHHPKLNKWSKVSDKCLLCHRTDRRHGAKGYCWYCRRKLFTGTANPIVRLC